MAESADHQAQDAKQPEARARPSRWPGLIWAIPVAALAIVIWLGVRDLAQQGPEVTVRFASAGNVEPGNTKVKYENMDVGEVESVSIENDLQHVDVKLQFRSNMSEHLGPGTRYWIAGEGFNVNNLSSIRSIISGPYIGVDPRPGHTVNHVDGLAEPPVTKAKEPGRSFTLEADKLGNVSRGTPISFLGMQVGEVQSYALNVAQRRFDIKIFIKAPYDDLVRPNTRFWDAAPVHLSSTPSGPSLEFQSVPALLQGAIAFETPSTDAPAQPSKDGAAFQLYSDHDTAENAPDSNGVAYTIVFNDQASGLMKGTPVDLVNTPIGSVGESRLEYDAASGTLRTRATIVLTPTKLHVVNAATDSHAAPRAAMDAMMRHLVDQGLRAELNKSPPMVGSPVVQLRFVPGVKAAALGTGSPPEIPTESGSDIDAIIAKAGDVMTKVDEMPLDQIAEEIHQATQQVAKISNSPALMKSLANLEHSLDDVRSITADTRRQIRPILAAVQRTAAQAQDAVESARAVLGNGGGSSENAAQTAALPGTLYELTRAARSLRELSDYLDRHPEALIEGKGGHS